MAKQMILNTKLYALILAFLKRKGINPNDVCSVDFKNVGGGPGIVTIELFYDEDFESPAPPAVLVRTSDEMLG